MVYSVILVPCLNPIFNIGISHFSGPCMSNRTKKWPDTVHHSMNPAAPGMRNGIFSDDKLFLSNGNGDRIYAVKGVRQCAICVGLCPFAQIPGPRTSIITESPLS